MAAARVFDAATPASPTAVDCDLKLRVRTVDSSASGAERGTEYDGDVHPPSPRKWTLNPRSPRGFATLAAALLMTLALLYRAYLSTFDAHQCTMSAMVCLDKVFRAHNIPYFLDYGSLLGSVRHGAMIPWDDVGDIDIGVLDSDTERIIALKSEFANTCGMRFIHRSDTASHPDISSFVIKRGAFRLFCASWVPYYVDLADYSVYNTTASDKRTQTFLTDRHFPDIRFDYPVDRVLPVKDCVFEGHTFLCPNDSEYVLKTLFGSNWRIPSKGTRPKEAQQEERAAAALEEAH